MYTTKPEAYKSLRNGLRVIAYGPVRNKAARARTAGVQYEVDPLEQMRLLQLAAAEPIPEAVAPVAPSDPQEAAEALHRAYVSGEAYDRATHALLVAALDAPESIISAVTDILLAVHEDADPTWRMTLLEHAEELAPAVARAPDGHAALLSAVAQLDTLGQPDARDPDRARQADAALTAYGQWGRWPEDTSDDVLGALEDGDDDPSTLRWYGVFLATAGVPRDVISANSSSSLRAYQGRPVLESTSFVLFITDTALHRTAEASSSARPTQRRFRAQPGQEPLVEELTGSTLVDDSNLSSMANPTTRPPRPTSVAVITRRNGTGPAVLREGEQLA